MDTPNRTTTRLSRPSNAASPLALAALAIAITIPTARGVTINYSSTIQPGVEHFFSNGDPILVAADKTSGVFFQVGTFTGGFVPTSANTDSWLANWTPVTTPAGDELPEATTEFTTFGSSFFPIGAFNQSLDLDHNNAPFTPFVAQGYIWGYNNRDTPGAAEWILITNSTDWKFPASQFGTTPTWSIGTSNPAESPVGSISGDSMTFGQVTIPGPVPEPSPAALALATVAAATLTRRRRKLS